LYRRKKIPGTRDDVFYKTITDAFYFGRIRYYRWEKSGNRIRKNQVIEMVEKEI